MISTSEYTEYFNIMETYGIKPDAMLLIVRYCVDRKGEDIGYKYGKKWCRCSFKTMAVYCPYLSIDQIKGAVCVMRKKGILYAMTPISSFEINFSAFV